MPIPLHEISAVERMPANGPDGNFIRMVQSVAKFVRDTADPASAHLPPPPGQRSCFCPFLRYALAYERVWFGTISSTNPMAIALDMKHFVAQFKQLEPTNDEVYRCVVMFLPGLLFAAEKKPPSLVERPGALIGMAEQQAAPVKIPIQRKLAESIRTALATDVYLPAGLMLAVSYDVQEDTSTGQWWTCPKFIVRWMVPQDKTFLERDNIDPDEQRIGTAVWQRKFGGGGSGIYILRH